MSVFFEYKSRKFYFFYNPMYRYSLVLCMIIYFTGVDSACLPSKKFYVDCGTPRTLSNSIQLCASYGMTLVNLTNSTILSADILDLNQTLVSSSCTNNFWFASGNTTGYIGTVGTLSNVLSSLLGGLGLVVGALLDSLLGCLIILCPFTTTPAPITIAYTVCTRAIQQRAIQKCQLSTRTDMKTFQFNEQPMYGGILSSFASRSRTACSGLCSEDTQCIGISYINDICTLYM